MITLKTRGNFNGIENFFAKAQRMNLHSVLERYAQMGVNALASATPKDTGLTSESWGYKIDISPRGYLVTWTNSHIVNGVPIAIILQYGHGTGNGGYVQGRDYINPALRPIFDELATNLFEEVSRL